MHALHCLLRQEGVSHCRQRVVEVVQPAAEEEPLPPEANPTLFLSGLPLDITKREVAHILRPFEGFKVGRIVSILSNLLLHIAIQCFCREE